MAELCVARSELILGAEKSGKTARAEELPAARGRTAWRPDRQHGDGNGKGKGTAAFALALRAHWRGKAVKIYQFKKVPTARFVEHRMSEQIGIPIEGLGDGFCWKSQDLERSAGLARAGWEKSKASILAGEHFLLVLDGITYPLIYGWLPLNDVSHTLRTRPRDVHGVVSGRRCPSEFIELADTVTEMTKIKHAFDAGVPAQRGIED